jgi:glycosyltransferase involved in cell wall biosynthesis
LPNVVRNHRWPELTATLTDVRRRVRFDGTWLERAHVAEAARDAGFRRCVVDVDTLETVAESRHLGRTPWYASKPLHYAEMAKTYLYERRLAARGDRVVVCKDEDRHFWGRNHPAVGVVPNGIVVGARADPGAEVPDELLFVGTLDYEPNIDAVRYFLADVWPRVRAARPGARLRIVGRHPVPAVTALTDGIIVQVIGDVPDLAPHYARAAVVVAPIRLGGGTRLKVLEALGMGKATVATPEAVEGLDLRPDVDFMLADRPDRFAAACSALLTDSDCRSRLGASGRDRVASRYSWDQCVSAAERVLFPPGSDSSAGRGACTYGS